ncbi:MAG: hypothetical protein ABSG53_22100 [Thermoguttaceae bacterium]|jgi:hypothetical protein
MFKGKAELTDPEKGHVVATFNETCHDDGTAAATVRLRTPITLQDTETLEIVGTATSAPMITVGASDPAGTEICEFHGKSAIGCIPDGADLTLVRSPGGRLGSLLIVIGKGKVHRSN